MKGLAPATAIIFSLVIVVMAGGLYFLEIHTSQLRSAIKSGRELAAFTVLGFVDLTKLYLPTTISFSIQQASFDLGKKGGFVIYNDVPFDVGENLPYWHLFSQDFSPSFTDFKNNLGNLTQSNINAYLKEKKINGINVSFDNYSTSVTKESSGVKVSLGPKTKIDSLVANSSFFSYFNEFYGIRIFELFSLAKNNLIDVKGTISNVLTAWNHETGSLEKEDESCPSITDEEVFEHETGKGFEEAKSYLSGEITSDIKSVEESLNSKYSGEKFSWSLDPVKTDVKINSDCRYDYECVKSEEAWCERCEATAWINECHEPAPRAICNWETICNEWDELCECVGTEDIYTCDACLDRGGGKEHVYKKECNEWVYSYKTKKSCDFDYYANVTVKLSITDINEKYIVWTGTRASEEYVQLNFLVKGAI